jgi:hypothetical protein
MVTTLQLSGVVADPFVSIVLCIHVLKHFSKLVKHLPDLILLPVQFPLQTLILSVSPV